MLEYIRSVEDMVNLGHNASLNTIVINVGKAKPQKWVKCFMNGDEVGFFVLARK